MTDINTTDLSAAPAEDTPASPGPDNPCLIAPTVHGVAGTEPSKEQEKEQRKDTPRPARKTTDLTVGQQFPGGRVKKISSRIPHGIGIVVTHGEKESFGALKDYLLAGPNVEARSARMQRIEKGEEAVPPLTVYEITPHGADFIETSFIEDKKRQERSRALRLMREGAWEEIEALAGSNVLLDATITRGGIKKYGVFVTLINREKTLKDGAKVRFTLDGMVHIDSLHGGEEGLSDRAEGDQLKVKVLKTERKQKVDKRTGRELTVLEISLAEVAEFNLQPGDVMRGARFKEEDTVDGVNAIVLNWYGFRCLLAESELGGTKLESLKKPSTKTTVTLLRQDADGKIWVTKKDTK